MLGDRVNWQHDRNFFEPILKCHSCCMNQKKIICSLPAHAWWFSSPYLPKTWCGAIADKWEVDRCTTAVALRLGNISHSVLNKYSGKTSIHSEAMSEVDEESDALPADWWGSSEGLHKLCADLIHALDSGTLVVNRWWQGLGPNLNTVPTFSELCLTWLIVRKHTYISKMLLVLCSAR